MALGAPKVRAFWEPRRELWRALLRERERERTRVVHPALVRLANHLLLALLIFPIPVRFQLPAAPAER